MTRGSSRGGTGYYRGGGRGGSGYFQREENTGEGGQYYKKYGGSGKYRYEGAKEEEPYEKPQASGGDDGFEIVKSRAEKHTQSFNESRGPRTA